MFSLTQYIKNYHFMLILTFKEYLNLSYLRFKSLVAHVASG